MNWIRQLFSRRRIYADLAEEIEQHLEERVQELVEQGRSRREAAAAARREFGNVTALQERGREVWRWSAVEDCFSDLRYALRQLRKSPAFALAAVLTLALGIGANTAVFSVVDAVVLRPLPYPHPEELVSVHSRSTRGTPHPETLSYPTFFDYRKNNQVFEHLVSYRVEDFVLTGPGEPLQVRGAIVSWDLFPLLQVQPALGRGFLPQEEHAGGHSVVLSYGLWRARFGADAAIVGATIDVDRQPHTVVGIAPAGFRFPVRNDPVELWTTLSRDVASATVQPITEQRGARVLDAIARLKPGVSLEQAQIQMDVVASAVAKEYPDQNGNIAGAYVRPEQERLVGDIRKPVFLLLGAVGLVLLITCANIANLLLARTAERGREFALRAAIGAGRGRIVRQVITESLVLSLLGCGVGTLAAAGLLGLAPRLAAGGLPPAACWLFRLASRCSPACCSALRPPCG
jgi:predicted permease